MQVAPAHDDRLTAWSKESRNEPEEANSCGNNCGPVVLLFLLAIAAAGQGALQIMAGHFLATQEIGSIAQSRVKEMALAGHLEASNLLRRGESVMRFALTGWDRGVNSSWAVGSKSCLAWNTVARSGYGIVRLEVKNIVFLLRKLTAMTALVDASIIMGVTVTWELWHAS